MLQTEVHSSFLSLPLVISLTLHGEVVCLLFSASFGCYQHPQCLSLSDNLAPAIAQYGRRKPPALAEYTTATRGLKQYSQVLLYAGVQWWYTRGLIFRARALLCAATLTPCKFGHGANARARYQLSSLLERRKFPGRVSLRPCH